MRALGFRETGNATQCFLYIKATCSLLPKNHIGIGLLTVLLLLFLNCGVTFLFPSNIDDTLFCC